MKMFPKPGSLLKRLLFWKKPKQETRVEQIHSKRTAQLTSEKKAELEKLCNHLFKQKELITSGKLQFIGLAKIKKRMGKKWAGLSKVVYETTEEVIDKHMDKGDVFIRYHDDTYIIIFAHADMERSKQKSALIAEEIRRRLFELDEEELRDLEIRQAVAAIQSDMLAEDDFLDGMFDALDNSFEDFKPLEDAAEPEPEPEQELAAPAPVSIETLEETPPPEMGGMEVDTEDYRPEKFAVKSRGHKAAALNCGYIPLWDSGRGALTTYLCMARGPHVGDNLFNTHMDVYNGTSPSEKAALDIDILKTVSAELQSMEDEDRKFYIVCPVQHETVYGMENYEQYKHALAQIPLRQRKLLMLLVMNMSNAQLPKNAYWFAKPLRSYCPHLMAEVPLRRDINFNYLLNSGVDVVGVKLSKKLMKEQNAISLLNVFGAKAKALKIPKTFVLDVTSLSLTTSAVCAGFDFLGGSAIHAAVDKPDSVHRYLHADLIKGLTGHTG